MKIEFSRSLEKTWDCRPSKIPRHPKTRTQITKIWVRLHNIVAAWGRISAACNLLVFDYPIVWVLIIQVFFLECRSKTWFTSQLDGDGS